MRKGLVSICLALAGILLAGCEPSIYRAETVLHSNGRVARAIYQPNSETPESAREAAWETTTFAPRVRHEEWDQSIRALRPAVSDKDRPYFAAWGEFASAADVPATFHVAAPQGYADGHLELDYQQEDFGLAVEHRWSETLTDIVTLDDLQRARQELADVIVPTLEKIVARGLGPEYDTSRLSTWLRESGTPLAYELTDAMFDLGARRGLSNSAATTKAALPVLERHGIRVRDESGHLLSDEALSESVVATLRNVLQDGIRHDGAPVRPAVADEILQWLNLMPVPEGQEKSQRYEEAAKQVIAEEFGGDEGLSQVIKPLGQRIFGLYRGLFFGPGSRRFDYSLEMPGVIVETNGQLLADNQVQFRFHDGDAYPFGYAMQARSLEPAPVAEKLLAGDEHSRRKQLLGCIDLVRDDAELRHLVKACAQAESLAPLRQARDTAGAAEKSSAKYDVLLRLLSPPVPSSDKS